jgi:hypothetical protein
MKPRPELARTESGEQSDAPAAALTELGTGKIYAKD